MHLPYAPLIVAPSILALNLPFGYWRSRCRKFSVSWFAAIHIPVILSITLRLMLGIAWVFYHLPIYVLSFVYGQYLGGRIAGRGQIKP